MANKKLLFWFPGTGVTSEERSNNTPELAKDYKADGHDITVVIADGVATSEMTDKEDTLSEDEQQKSVLGHIRDALFSLMGISPDVLEEFLIGYSEQTHLVQISEFLQALDDYIKEQEKRHAGGEEMLPFDLIIGGYSRGAAVGIVGFLVAFVSQLQIDDQNNEKGILFLKGLLKSMQFIVTDPAPGRDFSENKYIYADKSQDFMGLEKVLNDDKESCEINKENPLKTLMQQLLDYTDIPVSVYYLPARFETLQGLESSGLWNALAKDPPKDMALTTFQSGLNHFAYFRENEKIYTRFSELFGHELNPKKLLGMTIEVCLGLRDPKDLDVFYKKLRRSETVILAGLLKESARQSELNATSSKAVFNIPVLSNLLDLALLYMGERKTVSEVESEGDLILDDREVLSASYEEKKAHLRVADSDDSIINGRDIGLPEIQEMIGVIEKFQRRKKIESFDLAVKAFIKTAHFLDIEKPIKKSLGFLNHPRIPKELAAEIKKGIRFAHDCWDALPSLDRCGDTPENTSGVATAKNATFLGVLKSLPVKLFKSGAQFWNWVKDVFSNEKKEAYLNADTSNTLKQEGSTIDGFPDLAHLKLAQVSIQESSARNKSGHLQKARSNSLKW